MGIYIYTIRAKTVTVRLPSGEKIKANAYAYAYKDSSLPLFNPERRKAEFYRNNFHRHADNVFSGDISKYVYNGDVGEDPQGCTLYKNVSRSHWVDTSDFPAEPVGFLWKQGRSYIVKDRSPWEYGSQGLVAPGQWVEIRTREVMSDGKIIHETQYKMADGSWSFDSEKALKPDPLSKEYISQTL